MVEGDSEPGVGIGVGGGVVSALSGNLVSKSILSKDIVSNLTL